MLQTFLKVNGTILAFLLSGWAGASQPADMHSVPEILTLGFGQIDSVTLKNYRDSLIPQASKSASLGEFCQRLSVYFKKYGWDDDPCGSVEWHTSLKSKNGHPLIYATFGSGNHTTLLLSGVHPDEYTPVPVAFRFARYLKDNPAIYNKKNIRVIIAPLVNPDGFVRNVPSRTNANGIDLNRNFFTQDWYDSAIAWWQSGKRSDLRHFPGYFPNTEIETLFQVKMIDEMVPDKIVSIHAPLGFLDYDGPGDRKQFGKLSEDEKKARHFANVIAEKSNNYRIVDYSFYPGSLGNYAGNERGIPTVTLELSTTDPKMVSAFWKQFLPGLVESIEYPFKKISRGDGYNSNFYYRYKKLESEGHEQL
jgi:protein MpaA